VRFFLFFLLLQKETKRSPKNQYTVWFSVCALIYLLYYCGELQLNFIVHPMCSRKMKRAVILRNEGSAGFVLFFESMKLLLYKIASFVFQIPDTIGTDLNGIK
jgi:hypothetical protein